MKKVAGTVADMAVLAEGGPIDHSAQGAFDARGPACGRDENWRRQTRFETRGAGFPCQ